MKKLFIIIIILVLSVSSAVIYLDRVFFPTKIKSLLIQTIKEQTGKEVLLENLHFSIFKGLVFNNLSIYDGEKVILYIKEGSGGFLFLPFARKKIIIPLLTLKSAELLIERDKQGSLNRGAIPFPADSKEINLLMYKIRIVDSRIIFKDKTFEPFFSAKLDKINLTLHFSLPSRIRFSFYALFGNSPAASIECDGLYRINEKTLSAQLQTRNFSARQLYPYYQNLGITIPEGTSDIRTTLTVKDKIVAATVTLQAKNISIDKYKTRFRLNASLNSDIKYNLKDNTHALKGSADLIDCRISNLGLVEEVSAISGKLSFNENEINSEKLNILVWGLTLTPRLKIENFQDPEITMQLSTQQNITIIESILREKLRLDIPFKTEGACRLFLSIRSKLFLETPLQFAGYLDFQDAIFKAERFPIALASVRGKIEFNNEQLWWQNLQFKYADIAYKCAGSLDNYARPNIRLQVSSDVFYLDSIIKTKADSLEFLQLSGRYHNSKFSLFGEKNSLILPNLDADINADLVIECDDLSSLGVDFKARLKKMRLNGLLHTRLSLKGRLDEFLSWEVYAKITSPYLSFYGLKAKELRLLYTQKDGLGDISDLSFSLYGGMVRSAAKIDLKSTSLPYELALEVEGVDLKQLAADKSAETKEIAGSLHGQVKIKGSSNELSRINGAGKIFVTNGNLWQLNLFKGLGSLLFAKDFANIAFSEGYCSFLIEDKQIFTDELTLKSKIVNLYGPMKVKFSGSIEGALNIEILDANVPLTGTFKDVTTALIGRAGRFGVLKLSGTLTQPKYKFRPAVGDIIKGIKDAIIQ